MQMFIILLPPNVSPYVLHANVVTKHNDVVNPKTFWNLI